MKKKNKMNADAASQKHVTFTLYAQQLSQMEMRKRKLHHRLVVSRALMNKEMYPRTGQSPRIEYGDKPIKYDEPKKD